jgi:hypothetical protein
MSTALAPTLPAASPFDLGQPQAYAEWRERKLAQRGLPPVIEIANLGALTGDERRALLDTAQQRNFARFRNLAPSDHLERDLRELGRRLGLLDLDQNLCAEDSGLTAITVKQTDTDHTYIPYTNRPLGWHTDGYYNAGGLQIRAWLLYCARPAAEGGANGILDHEIAYIRLRDHNPEWIRALMADDAFTIPSNTEKGQEIRPDHAGPVFSISADGTLHMRYSARQRNVVWKDDDDTRGAATFLLDLFKAGDDHMFELRLNAGEGIISNNILHRRDGFRDPQDTSLNRLMYRARYYQRLPQPED